MDTDELLQRLSATLRNEVGPAVDGEYTRTQAYMAAVILEKVGRQVGSAGAHAEAERRDLVALHDDLAALVDDDRGPPALTAAVERARDASTIESLGPLIVELYRHDPEADPVIGQALSRVRTALRADIDRRMEIAR